MAGETSRWLAVNGASLDTAVAQHVNSTMLPGLAGGTPTMDATSTTTDAYYHIGTMDVRFTVCNPQNDDPDAGGSVSQYQPGQRQDLVRRDDLQRLEPDLLADELPTRLGVRQNPNVAAALPRLRHGRISSAGSGVD